MIIGGRSVSFGPPPWGPLALSPVLWLDAADAATLFQDSGLTTPAVADADPVGGWTNKAIGASVHAIQATSTKRGTLKLAQVGGQNVVRFDGVDDFLEANGLAALFSGTDLPFSVFMAFKKLSNTSTDGLFSISSSSSGTPFHIIRTNAATSFDSSRRDDASAAVVRSGGTPDTSAHVLAVAFDGQNVLATLDGSQIVSNTQNVGALTLDRLTVGMGRTNVEADAGHLDLAELILTASGLAASALVTGAAYLRNKWGI